MKKTMMLLLAAMTALALSACGGKQNGSGSGQEGGEAQYTDALQVLDEVFRSYGEADLFASYGGNQENPVMDAPGAFDISKTEELEYALGLPESQISNIEGAASWIHMMNTNTFTGVCYRLKDGVDMDSFVDSVKSSALEKQWVCGQPDTLVIINVDGKHVIAAYGAAELMEVFKTNALSALAGAQTLVEAPIA